MIIFFISCEHQLSTVLLNLYGLLFKEMPNYVYNVDTNTLDPPFFLSFKTIGQEGYQYLNKGAIRELLV